MYNYYNNCVGWTPSDVWSEGGLSDMIDQNIEISRRCFLAHVNRGELAGMAHEMGYCAHPGQGLTMAGDYHVSYHRSNLHGERVYYFRHSAIEYVFHQ